MSTQLSEGLSGFVHLVERQMLLYEERRKLIQEEGRDQMKDAYRFIAISRDIGALGDSIAAEAARRLKWKVYDKEIVDYIANHSHIRRELLDRLDEKAQGFVHESVERWLSLFQGQAYIYDEYHTALIRTLATLAAQGRSILLGHGAPYALQNQPGLRVRITASFPVRVRRLSQRWGTPIDRTEETVLKEDAERREFVRHHFKPDRDEDSYFHIVFNTDTLSVDQAAAAIVAIIEESRRSEEARQDPSAKTITFQNSEQSFAHQESMR